MAQCQINHRKSTRPWRFHKTTGGGPGALFFSSPMPEPEESPPRTPIGGHLPNCGLLERNAAGGMAPQPVGERSVNLATEEARLKTKLGESTITFWVFRTIPRGFLCVLTTPSRTQFSTLETKMRKKVLGRSALSGFKTGAGFSATSCPAPTCHCQSLNAKPCWHCRHTTAGDLLSARMCCHDKVMGGGGGTRGPGVGGERTELRRGRIRRPKAVGTLQPNERWRAATRKHHGRKPEPRTTHNKSVETHKQLRSSWDSLCDNCDKNDKKKLRKT
jgi:hypothetical protein